MPKRSSKLDMNQLAKRIVDESTGEAPVTQLLKEKNKSAQELGKKRSGDARAEKLTKEQRVDIARLAALARWKKTN